MRADLVKSCHHFALVVVIGLPAACSFVQARGAAGECDYRKLSWLLRDLNQARVSGGDVSEWWEAHGRDWGGVPVETWDQAAGQLYAARSAARIRHDPYVSPSITCVEIGLEGVAGGNIGIGGFILFGVVVSPIELLTLPVWFVRGCFRNGAVDDAELLQAAGDLVRARDLGYVSERVEQATLFGGPTWGYLHLDQIGYNAAWLREQQ